MENLIFNFHQLNGIKKIQFHRVINLFQFIGGHLNFITELLLGKLRRRTCMRLIFFGSIGGVIGCKFNENNKIPCPPYGESIDVMHSNSMIAFDIIIKKPDGYDIILEIFKKTKEEEIMMPKLVNARFEISIESLTVPDMVIAINGQPTLQPRNGFSPSITEKKELISACYYLVDGYYLSPGIYRIRCTNHVPLSILRGRLVKISMVSMHHPK